MEKKTMGSFIAALRKAKGMTQQDVADRLNVSNKTVSKWERDEGYPEITMLPVIAELFEVTTDELLRGERIFDNNRRKNKEETEEEKKTRIIQKDNHSLNLITALYLIFSAITLAIDFAITVPFSLGEDFLNIWIASEIAELFGLFAGIVLIILVFIHIVFFVIINNRLKENRTNADSEVLISNRKKFSYALFVNVVAFITALGCLMTLALSNDDDIVPLLTVPVWLTIGLLIDFCISYILKKSWFGKEAEVYSKETKNDIRKMAKVICILFVFGIILSGGYIISEARHIKYESHCFTEPLRAHFYYADEDEAINNYNKLKNCITEGKELYYLYYSYESSSLCELSICSLSDLFVKNGQNEYKKNYTEDFIDVMKNRVEKREFDSIEERDKFAEEFVWKGNLNLKELNNNICFNDSTHTIKYNRTVTYNFNRADIPLILFAMSSTGCILALAAVAIFWIKKKGREE